MAEICDKLVIGAGLYGLYSALYCARLGQNVVVLEKDEHAFSRATYINQARVHMGYHYPRSFSTAMKSKSYFDRFISDYGFCIADEFLQIYATSTSFSWTDQDRFIKFCRDVGIMCDPVSPDIYFNSGLCDGAYITREYVYDADMLRHHILDEIKKHTNVKIVFCNAVLNIERGGELYRVTTSRGNLYETPYLLNTTYASCNEIISLAGFKPFDIKYELCEIILCEVSDPLKNIGITVMDGPFFSIIPFGKQGIHSLTSVTFTPHCTSYEHLPVFECQATEPLCSPQSLNNCNSCKNRPESSYPYMRALARKYLLPKYEFSYKQSLFSMKPIMTASEIDDGRPTVIRKFSSAPTFVSVLSGKINTVYDLDKVLKDG